MNKKNYVIILFFILAVVLAAAAFYISHHPVALLNPKGTIASRERSLMITATLLMLIVVVPVYFLTFFIAWRYREGNRKARYEPDWAGSRRLELTWWAVPTVIITILAVITWNSSHSLDPFRAIKSDKPPLKIQVIALQWKWLFIYPKQDVASVNFAQFPKNTPVEFDITADAPMNSFWIPQLGGQIYAMSGMSTKLHLVATETGSFPGASANISGRGFAGMKFIARASTDTEFQQWLKTLKAGHSSLSPANYNQLAQPSENNKIAYYSSTHPNLYDQVVMKFMTPPSQQRGNYDLARDILSAAPGGVH
jgi:cytochrome o ubiquinol oxidase subunit II